MNASRSDRFDIDDASRDESGGPARVDQSTRDPVMVWDNRSKKMVPLGGGAFVWSSTSQELIAVPNGDDDKESQQRYLSKLRETQT